MPMTRDEHEALLNELNNPELDHSRRTDILQLLRTQHTTDLTDFDGLTKTNQSLKKDNDDLVLSNSKLFRQVGIVGTDKEKEEEHKEFSQTITIEDLERG
jgi:hypothetical protein